MERSNQQRAWRRIGVIATALIVSAGLLIVGGIAVARTQSRSEVPGVAQLMRLLSTRRSVREVSTPTGRLQVEQAGGCVLSVTLDGVELPSSRLSRSGDRLRVLDPTATRAIGELALTDVAELRRIAEDPEERLGIRLHVSTNAADRACVIEALDANGAAAAAGL